MGRPTKHELKSSTAAVAPGAPVAPPPPEQPSQHESKGTAKVPAAGPAPAAPSTFTVPERQGDRRDNSDSGEDDPAADVLLRAVQVRKRYGDASDMWLWRKLDKDPDFPRPIYIGPVRYWRAQAERPTPKPRILKHRDRALAALAEKRARRKAEQAADAGGAQSSA